MTATSSTAAPPGDSQALTSLPRRLYRPAGIGIVVLSMLVKLWAMRQWSWFQDDWSYVERTVDLGFLGYVLQEYNGHFMPGQFLLVWLITAISPLNYDLAILLLAALILLATVLWWLVFERLFGRRPQVLLALTVLALCPLLIQPTMWWAAGLQVYGLLAGMAAVLLCAVQYMNSPRALWLVATGASFLGALTFWQKSLLILIPFLFLVWVLPGIDRSQAAWKRRAAAITGTVLAVAVAYAAVFLVATADEVAGEARLTIPHPEALLGFALTAGLGIALPSLIGGTWQPVFGLQGAFPMAPTWLQWALGLLACAVIVVAVATRRNAGWIVLAGTTYALAAWALIVGSSRFGSLGQFASLDSRYSADLVAPLVLSGLYLISSTVTERRSGGAWLVVISPRVAGFARAASLVLMGVVGMSSLVTWSIQMDGLGPNSPRPWTDKLLSSAKALGPAVVFNSNAPDNVVFPAFLPADARVSRMLSPLGLPLQFDVPTPQMQVVSPSGLIVPGEVAQQSRTWPGPQPDCGYLLRPGDPEVTVPVSREMYNWNWGMQMGYLAEGPSVVRVRADLAEQDVPVQRGLGSVQSVLVSAVTSLRLSVPSGAVPVCVDYVAFGPFDPAAPS